MMALAVVAWGHTLYNPLVYNYQKVQLEDPTLADSLGVCEYFNRRGISFSGFRKSVWEIMPSTSESSFSSIGFCFARPDKGTESGNEQFLLVSKEHRDKDPRLFLPLVKGVADRAYHLEAQTNEYLIYSTHLELGVEPITNLSNIYHVDLALPLARQLRENARADFFSGSEARVDTYETKLCSDGNYCGVFVYSQLGERGIKIRIVSKALQNVWGMFPLNARFEGSVIEFVCDGRRLLMPMAESVGVVGIWQRPRTIFAPLNIFFAVNCKKMELRALAAAKVELAIHGAIEEFSDVTYDLKKIDLE
jgi:hypothetical protein